jgi:nucleotide-binding universal stress UspA family protein
VIHRMRILVAVSHARPSEQAFEQALALARTSGAELHAVHAVPAERPFSARAAERLARWTDLRARAAAAGVPLETGEQHGDPADVIVLHAGARGADLIVMATARRTGWNRLLEPSVAERVLRRTRRPVLVVSDDGVNASTLEDVIVAVDLTPASTSFLDTARRLLGDGVRRLTMVHAADRVERGDAVWRRARWGVPADHALVQHQTLRRLEWAAAGLRRAGACRDRLRRRRGGGACGRCRRRSDCRRQERALHAAGRHGHPRAAPNAARVAEHPFDGLAGAGARGRHGRIGSSVRRVVPLGG